MRLILHMIFAAFAVFSAHAQMMNPAHFTSELRQTKAGEGEIVFHAVIDEGWHVYSTDVAGGGPTPASFHAVSMEGVEPLGGLRPRGQAVRQFDEIFQMEVSYFEREATFVQPVRFTAGRYSVDCYLEYGACNDEMCLPPTEVPLKTSGEAVLPAADKEEEGPSAAVADTAAAVVAGGMAAADSASSVAAAALGQGVAVEAAASVGAGGDSLLSVLLMGLLGGLLAVLMPCIWPVIPMTVAFFMKRTTDRRRGLCDAVLYGLSIIIIYVGLGLAVTAIFGSDALNVLSTSAVVNVLLFLMLLVFGLSLLGLFELRLPSSWSNAIDRRASSTTGMLSIFLMALTLVVVSFSCTAPIIGLLLVEASTGGSYLAPAVGMTGFALALALPFTLFALFPSWLKELPRSGPWMNMLKVTLGFVEIAFSLKFLSVADQAYGWHLLSRRLFFILWIVIFVLLGIYLLRVKVRGAARVVAATVAAASLALAVYMVPGLWGAPCTLVSAFAPPMEEVKARYNDYDEALKAARREKKPVLIDFTGYGCVNCRKMEAAVWTNPRVAKMLREDFILVSLYVDDRTALPQPIEVTDVAGNKRTLRTVGARWSHLQSSRYGSNAQPYYIITDTEGNPIAPPRGYNEDAEAYIEWMKSSAILTTVFYTAPLTTATAATLLAAAAMQCAHCGKGKEYDYRKEYVGNEVHAISEK